MKLVSQCSPCSFFPPKRKDTYLVKSPLWGLPFISASMSLFLVSFSLRNCQKAQEDRRKNEKRHLNTPPQRNYHSIKSFQSLRQKLPRICLRSQLNRCTSARARDVLDQSSVRAELHTQHVLRLTPQFNKTQPQIPTSQSCHVSAHAATVLGVWPHLCAHEIGGDSVKNSLPL